MDHVAGATAWVDELGTNLQVLQVVRLRFHVFFQIGQELSQGSVGQSLDNVFLLIEV